MTLKHTVLTAVMVTTEAAITNDSLRCVLAFFELTADFLGGAALEWQSEVKSAFPCNRVIGQ